MLLLMEMLGFVYRVLRDWRLLVHRALTFQNEGASSSTKCEWIVIFEYFLGNFQNDGSNLLVLMTVIHFCIVSCVVLWVAFWAEIIFSSYW